MSENTLESLVDLVRQLRAPDGCPWDREQTHESITGFLIEEAYEVVHAIKEKNSESLKDELGDLLLHVAFHAQLAHEAGSFDLEDVLDSIHEKVIRRHPHVFEQSGSKEIGEIKLKWEELKSQESHIKKSTTNSFPALVEARKLIEKSSNLGDVDLEVSRNVPGSLGEEIAGYIDGASEDDIGKLLFCIVDQARTAGYEAEISLKQKNKQVRELIESQPKESNS